MNDKSWLYLKIGIGEFGDVLDHFVRDVLPRAVREVGAQQWFFIRYYDDTDGLHLRFRVLIDKASHQGALDRLGAIFRYELTHLNALPKSSYQPLVAMGGFDFEARALSVREEAYEPELDKFGGADGMPVAERWFHQSSELAVAALQQESRRGLSRKSLAPVLMAVVVDQMVSDPCMFLEHYSMSWLPHDIARRQMLRDEFFAKAGELHAHAIAIVPALAALPAESQALVERWRDSVAAALLTYARHEVASPGYTLNQAWQMIHLMNNRLGFSPIEEAYLATLLETHYRMSERHAS